MKKSLLILFLLILSAGCYAEPIDRGGHAGTPPGFYDDIDPNTLDDEDSEPATEENYGYSNTKPGAPVFDEEGNFQKYNETNSSFDYTQPKPTKNYADIYNSLEPATHSYLHGIDPDEFYDTKDATWSVYPLLRLNSAIYFKSIVIEPGYYLLTPREHKGKWYILFKQNGRVSYIIPVYERDYTPEKFYDEHIPKPKLKPTQKVHMKILDAVGKVKTSKRQEPVKSFLEVNDLDNYFVGVVIYYGGHKYSTLFRTIRL